MTEKTIDLDKHRGMAAQKATDLRRLVADVEANEKALRLRQDELEAHLLAAPAANWREAAEKARYLLNLFAAFLGAQDPPQTEADCRRDRRFRATRAGIDDGIRSRRRSAGKDIEHLTTDDLAPVDEFHTRGRTATTELAHGGVASEGRPGITPKPSAATSQVLI
jgi:hypothetical protein